jgi:hypothetical protein
MVRARIEKLDYINYNKHTNLCQYCTHICKRVAVRSILEWFEAFEGDSPVDGCTRYNDLEIPGNDLAGLPNILGQDNLTPRGNHAAPSRVRSNRLSIPI